MGDRCKGHCCKSFYVGHTPAELEAMAVDSEEAGAYDCALDRRTIARMLVPVEGEDGKYTCVHHNAETGDCGIYLTRPRMCRDWPYDKPCPKAECAWDVAKAGLHPSKVKRHLPMYREPEVVYVRAPGLDANTQ